MVERSFRLHCPEGGLIMRRLLAGLLALTAAGAAWAEEGDSCPLVPLPRRGVDYVGGSSFRKRFADKEWEIRECFEHENGHLGTFSVGDSVGVAFTVGVKGQRAVANVKNFPAPVARVYILEEGKVKEVLEMKRGAC